MKISLSHLVLRARGKLPGLDEVNELSDLRLAVLIYLKNFPPFLWSLSQGRGYQFSGMKNW